MSKYEFQGSQYRGERDMLDAIAETWLTANGANDQAYQHEVFAKTTDEDLAAECIAGWALDLAGDQPPFSRDEDREPSHMTENGYTEDDLARAFGRLRASLLNPDAADLVLCRSDAGDGGWSLHAPGSTDEEIAEGDAPYLVTGDAVMLPGGDWDRPNAEDYAAAMRVLKVEG